MDLSNPTQLKQHMRVLRKRFGAKSKIGHRASNVEGAVHQIQHGLEAGPTGEFQRTNLEKSIKRWLTELNGLLTPA